MGELKKTADITPQDDRTEPNRNNKKKKSKAIRTLLIGATLSTGDGGADKILD